MRAQPEKKTQTILLKIESLTFNYKSQNAFKGLRNISFEIKKGEFISLLGKSGSGKTSLLKCIFGMEDLQHGKIMFLEEQVKGPSYQLLPGHPGMSLVSQDFYVLDHHSVRENIAEKLIGWSDHHKDLRIDELLRVLQLSAFEQKKAKELSSGQRQRLSIARALADFPKLLLLDEPFSNLDAALKDKILNYIRKEAAKKHSAVIMVTHHAEDTLKFSDQIFILKEGKIMQKGSPEKVFFQPKSLETALLFGKAFRVKNFPGNIKILRPEYLQESESNDGDIKLKVEENNFCGGCFEVSGNDEQKNQISFYSENPVAHDRREIYLKLRKGISGKV